MEKESLKLLKKIAKIEGVLMVDLAATIAQIDKVSQTTKANRGRFTIFCSDTFDRTTWVEETCATQTDVERRLKELRSSAGSDRFTQYDGMTPGGQRI